MYGKIEKTKLQAKTQERSEKQHVCHYSGCGIASVSFRKLVVHKRTHAGENSFGCKPAFNTSGCLAKPNAHTLEKSRLRVTTLDANSRFYSYRRGAVRLRRHGCKPAFASPGNLTKHKHITTTRTSHGARFKSHACAMAFKGVGIRSIF